jgi:hypothetical protein
MITMIDIILDLKRKGYLSEWLGGCNIKFKEEYNFNTIPKGFIFKDNSLIQVIDRTIKDRDKQNNRDVKVLKKWVKSL